MDPNAPSYVERKADRDLLQALLAREYVFLLDSRQKGKSSLIARTMLRLMDHGVRTVKLDLQRIGANLSPDQWYAGLLHEVCRELDCAEPVFKVWGQLQHVGPLARFVNSLEVAITSTSDPLVIFVDEIDFVRALPFSVDEFFAAIRDCFNRRSQSAAFQRLTFCLSGVATAGQLIQNPEVTPFNVGKRIDIPDFDLSELRPYAAALKEAGLPGDALLARVYYWVGGHPYLTQSLCAEIVLSGSASADDVDQLVESMLTAPEQRQRNPNLSDMERRLLEPFAPGFDVDEARSRVLDVYRRILRHLEVGADFDDPAVATLLLAGVARTEKGRLVLRNRVYAEVFNEAWRRASLPGAERLRQTRAFRAGAFRVGLIALIVLIVLGSLAIKLAFLAAERDQAQKLALEAASAAERSAYSRTLALIEMEADDDHFQRVSQLLSGIANSKYKGWEYGYWFRRLNEHSHAVKLGGKCGQLVIRTDGTLVVGLEQVVEVLDSNLSSISRTSLTSGQWRLTRDGVYALVEGAARQSLSTVEVVTGRTIATVRQGAGHTTDPNLRCAPQGNSMRLFTATDETPIDRIPLLPGHIHTRTSPSGRFVFMASLQRSVVFDRQTRRRVEVSTPFFATLRTVQFSRDESSVWLAGSDAYLLELSIDRGRIVRQVGNFKGGVGAFAFDPNEKNLLVGCTDGTARIIDVRSGAEVRRLAGLEGAIAGVGWAPNGQVVYVASREGVLRAYDLRVPPPVWTIRDHRGQAGRVVLARGGNRMLTVSDEGTCRVYDPKTRRPVSVIAIPGAPQPGYIKLTTDGRLAYIGGNAGEIVCIDVDSGTERWRSPSLGSYVTTIAVNHGNSSVYVGTNDGEIVRIDAKTGRLVRRRKLPQIYAGPARPVAAVRGGALNRDGSALAVGVFRDLYVLDAVTLDTLRTRSFAASEGDVRSTTTSNTGDSLLVGLAVVPVEVTWSALNTQRTFGGHTDRVFYARYSPSGRMVYTASMDGSARVIDLRSGRLVMKAQHEDWVSSVEISQDESRLLTASADGTVRLWGIDTGEQLLALPGHHSLVFSAVFSQDEELIATAAQDGRVIVYYGLQRDQLTKID